MSLQSKIALVDGQISGPADIGAASDQTWSWSKRPDFSWTDLLLFSFLFLSTQSLEFFMVICCADICKSFSFPLQSFYLNYTMYTLYITQNYNADIQLCIPKHMVKWQKLLAYLFLFMKSQIHITQQFANMCNSLNKGEIHGIRTPDVFLLGRWDKKLWVIF